MEIITITPVDDYEYIETTLDNNGNTRETKIFHKDGITYRQDETGEIIIMENYEEANNEMPVPIFFDPSIVN